MNKWLKVIGSVLIIMVLIIVIIQVLFSMNQHPQLFNSERALNDVKYQVELGPRTMGSTAHEHAVSYIVDQLKRQDWQVETQQAVVSGQQIVNIIAKNGEGTPWMILGSHYDSRSLADQDSNPANRKLAVPGADDGASSTAILLELARVFPKNENKQIWLVFFDDEDNGNASGSGWSVGSTYFVSQLQGKPDGVVVLDMVGDKDLNIYMEGNSDREMNNEIWSVAKSLGYAQFIPTYKYNMIDDHTPFLQAGIRAVDVIDFDYPYWHTTNDSVDKVSAESLKAVGDTMLKWLEEYPLASTPVP
jgi:Zn-dependent M28 family amino/carboxypeptidase